MISKISTPRCYSCDYVLHILEKERLSTHMSPLKAEFPHIAGIRKVGVVLRVRES